MSFSDILERVASYVYRINLDAIGVVVMWDSMICPRSTGQFFFSSRFLGVKADQAVGQHAKCRLRTTRAAGGDGERRANG